MTKCFSNKKQNMVDGGIEVTKSGEKHPIIYQNFPLLQTQINSRHSSHHKSLFGYTSEASNDEFE